MTWRIGRALAAIAAGALSVAAIAAGALSVAACATTGNAGSDPCAIAIDRVESDCGFKVTVAGADAGAELECTGSAACAADCLTTTPCDDIGKHTQIFQDCLDACPK